MQVTTGEQQDCNKFIFQNGMLQETELDDDDDDDMMVMMIRNIDIEFWNLEPWREKQKMQQGQLKTKQSVQTVLRTEFW